MIVEKVYPTLILWLHAYSSWMFLFDHFSPDSARLVSVQNNQTVLHIHLQYHHHHGQDYHDHFVFHLPWQALFALLHSGHTARIC